MVGRAIWRTLESRGYTNLVGRSVEELDLTDQAATGRFFAAEKPEYVFLAAARVGGIHANKTFPAQFIYENLMIQNNVIHNAYLHGVKKLLFLGSSCIYPKNAPQPIKEEYLLSDYLEPTNEAYAIAKIAGIKMCQMYRKQYGCDFISVMPCNLYGIGDNYHPKNSHVIPALIRRFHEAKMKNAPEVVCWGTGKPLREFLFADDVADACLFLMEHYSEEIHINIGAGKDQSIRELAELVAKTVGYTGKISWDHSKPDGTYRKLMDNSRIRALGWNPSTSLEEGLAVAYRDFLSRYAAGKQ